MPLLTEEGEGQMLLILGGNGSHPGKVGITGYAAYLRHTHFLPLPFHSAAPSEYFIYSLAYSAFSCHHSAPPCP